MARRGNVFRFGLVGKSFRPTASRTYRHRRRGRAGHQRQIPAAETQPVRAVEPSLDLDARPAQPCPHLFAWHTPPLSFPTHPVVVGHGTRRAHAENLLPAMLAAKRPVRVARASSSHREAPLLERHELLANFGVDPATNHAGESRVLDQSSSSPTVLPDVSVLYGAYSRYNIARGHLFKFSSTGEFLAAFDFGWDTTPAVFSHDGTCSIVIKDNHYDEEAGFYCNPSGGVSDIVCDSTGIPAGPFYITQLDANLVPE